jgi:hypothetical protein
MKGNRAGKAAVIPFHANVLQEDLQLTISILFFKIPPPPPSVNVKTGGRRKAVFPLAIPLMSANVQLFIHYIVLYTRAVIIPTKDVLCPPTLTTGNFGGIFRRSFRLRAVLWMRGKLFLSA